MGFKERPKCCMEGCDNPALIFMLNRCFCGSCIVKWDKIQNEKMFKEIQEVIKDAK